MSHPFFGAVDWATHAAVPTPGGARPARADHAAAAGGEPLTHDALAAIRHALLPQASRLSESGFSGDAMSDSFHSGGRNKARSITSTERSGASTQPVELSGLSHFLPAEPDSHLENLKSLNERIADTCEGAAAAASGEEPRPSEQQQQAAAAGAASPPVLALWGAP